MPRHLFFPIKNLQASLLPYQVAKSQNKAEPLLSFLSSPPTAMSTSPDASKSRRLPPPPSQQTPLLLFPPQRTPSAARLRRRRTTTVRLGGRRRSWAWRAGKVFVSTLRRIKLRWMAGQYARAVKKLSNYYAGLLRDFVEGAAAMEAVQARILSEIYFAVPVLPAISHCNGFL
ncbi:hypothetical protein M5K25_020589 [Dendrobium thyrsiflorum]|uniref:Uncharacterized protein n=1 Tax=Dendrobium thyrsiflorum TaxID=117978 RepID=A0ABD0UAB8_DENTH